MKTVITPEIKEVMEAMHYRPAVSIIMPFEPNMSLKKALTYSLKNAIDKVEEELLENYPDGMGILVIQKLKAIVKGLNFNTYKKTFEKMRPFWWLMYKLNRVPKSFYIKFCFPNEPSKEAS